jgi:CopG family transcriptional regulator, nickel-responsive regulator
VSLERLGVSMDGELLRQFDGRIAEAGYASRSEAIRDLVRDYLVRDQWQTESGTVVGTVTLVYDHHTRLLGDKLTDIQHDHHTDILCSTHVHLDHHNCLEIVVLAGPAPRIRALAEALISTRGVKHGALTCTSTGEDL